MDLREEIRMVRSLGTYVTLKKTPDRITDVHLLEMALTSIEDATARTGREYVFKEIQQLSIGSSIKLYPKEYDVNTAVNWVLTTYDKTYFVNRIRELKEEAYQ